MTNPLPSTQPDAGRDLLTKSELAERLRVKPRTVNNLMQRGLPYLRINPRLVRFSFDEVRRWLNRQFSTRHLGPLGSGEV